MKHLLLASPALRAAALLAGPRDFAGPTQKQLSLAVARPSQADKGVLYGDSRCPCIGFDNVEGDTLLQLEVEGGQTVEMTYPADVGAHCEAWDEHRHVQCNDVTGRPEAWCAQQWCYVDPCNCDIDVLPKIAVYNSEASFRGKPLFWSYATCGGKDMFTQKKPELGSGKCRCIGFEGMAGTMEVSFKEGETAEYPATLGASCQAWDLNVHPDCKGDKVASWCKAAWCYVDPCECDLPGDVVPKISAYLPEATFTGKNLYYSYETCGGADTWTEDHHEKACVNLDDEWACFKNERCEWDKKRKRCLGWELVDHPLCLKRKAERAAKSGNAPQRLTMVSIAAVAVAIAAACA